MSDIFKDLAGEGQGKKYSCRVAYTLNNYQPVLCTIIGDQPLFYMDVEAGSEDDFNGFDASELGILESEVSALKKQIACMERFVGEEGLSSESKLAEFASESLFLCSPEESSRSSDLDRLVQTLGKSRLASSYLTFARQYDVTIQYGTQVEKSFYDRDSGQILINPALCFEDQILLAAQELRRHWQHRQGVLIHPLMFHPDNAILINRVQIADLSVSMVRIAWELQLSGEKAAWDRLEVSSMGDLARAFAREAFLDFRTINNGLAAACVFEAWFLSERCRTQDKLLINQMLSDYQGYVFDLSQSEQNITPTLIAGLGTMPFGKNYLAEHAMTIIDDSIFTDVRDRSNANFLWFIKFERSFRETEHDLQSTVDPSAGSIPLPGTSKTVKDQSDASQAQIVALFPEQTHSSEKPKKGRRKGERLLSTSEKGGQGNEAHSSNVVYLRRWPGE